MYMNSKNHGKGYYLGKKVEDDYFTKYNLQKVSLGILDHWIIEKYKNWLLYYAYPCLFVVNIFPFRKIY